MTYPQGGALLSAGLDYGQKGYAHYPVSIEITETGKKRPSFHVNWGEESSTDPAQTWAWFGPGAPYEYAGVGIDCHRSGIAVVDLDGQEGIDNWERLCAEHGEAPAPWVRTRSGGRHYYYRQRPDAPIYNTASKVAPGVDVRGAKDSSGKSGGTVFAAPTRIQGVEGQAYEWQTPLPPAAQLPLTPVWLQSLAKKKSQERREKQRAVLPARPSVPRTADGVPVDPQTGLLLDSYQGTPPGLRRYVESKLQEIRDLPVDGPGESPVNDRAFELSHYVPHQLELDALRAALRAAVDTWEEGQETGYAGIEHGLRNAGAQDPKVWEEWSFSSGRSDIPGSGQQASTGESGFLPAPFVPDEVVDHLLPVWQQDGLLTLRNWRDDWMRWRTTHWRAQNRVSIRAEVYPMLKGKKYRDAGGAAKPWGADRNKVANLLEILEAVTYLDQDVTPGSWFEGDGPGGIVAMRNGLLDMRTRELLPHTPRYFNISSLPFDYDAQAAEPAEFLKFLASIWEDDQQSIQTFLEWAAYVLSGRTDLQKMLLLIGPKRSGKGTLARILTALVGKENVGGPSLADFGKQFGLEDLVDKPLAIVGDARMPSNGEREILGNLLSISGEDGIRADRKHRDAWVGRLPTRITILSNELPSFADSSGAIASRFVILRMTKSFIGKEDKDLEQRLMAELPGIFNLVLDAGRDLEARGHLVEPDSSETARSILSDTTSPIEVFLEECCQENPDPEAATAVEWMFWAWTDWCNGSGRSAYVGTKEGFAKRLLSARPGVRRTRPRVDGAQVPHYQGVLLIDSLMAKCQKRATFEAAAAIAAESGLSQGPSWGQQPTFSQMGWGESG